MSQPAGEAFQPLQMPVRTLAGGIVSMYRVYAPGGECKEIEAETAAEAMKGSGVEEVSRIVREIKGREVLIPLKKLLEEPPAG